MEKTTKVIDCVEFKNELHEKLYKKSGATNFHEYIKYINSVYSDNGCEKIKARPPALTNR